MCVFPNIQKSNFRCDAIVSGVFATCFRNVSVKSYFRNSRALRDTRDVAVVLCVFSKILKIHFVVAMPHVRDVLPPMCAMCSTLKGNVLEFAMQRLNSASLATKLGKSSS